jgi:multidrug efflux system outer membrane protein
MVALATLAACTLMPRYEQPAAPVPAQWSQAESTADPIVAADLPWRTVFPDPRLQRVIELALDNNRDLRVAALHVEKAQAAYRIQRAELFPGVGVLAEGERTRLPENLAEDGRATTASQYSVSLGFMSWELDLFGRIRSLEAQALASYLATEQARVATRTALIAATAGAYLTRAADAESLELARATLEAQRATLALIEASRDVGIASDLELFQARSQVEAARTDVARLTAAVALDHHALELVVGAQVGEDLLPAAAEQVAVLDELAPGLPSDVLLRRPDILAAEQQLVAANASIGAARAAFFPRISLTAGVGLLSPDLSGLFDSGGRTWTFAPQIVAPIFAGGSLKANLEVSEVDREIAVARYEKAIQTAFAEVADALTLRASLIEQLDAQQALVRALDDTFRTSTARFEAGIDSYLVVLVAQRSLYVAQRAEVALRWSRQANLVALYKALGGGGEEVGTGAVAAPSSPQASASTR